MHMNQCFGLSLLYVAQHVVIDCQPFLNFGMTLACDIGLSTVVIWVSLSSDFDCNITMPWCKDLLGVSYGCRIIVVGTCRMLDIEAHKKKEKRILEDWMSY